MLIDAAVKGHYGGTGSLADWQLAKKIALLGKKLILSGGLQEDNLIQAWREVKPFALDLCSGVEQSKGIKSPEKLTRLFQLRSSYDGA